MNVKQLKTLFAEFPDDARVMWGEDELTGVDRINRIEPGKRETDPVVKREIIDLRFDNDESE